MKKYRDDYKLVIKTDERGRQITTTAYQGDYFEVKFDKGNITHLKRYCLLLLVVSAALHIAGGFIGNQGMYQFYIALPYAIAFFPLLHLAMGIVSLPKEKKKYRRDEIGTSFERMKTASIILLILLGFGAAGETLFLLFHSAIGEWQLEYLYLAVEVLAGAAIGLLITMQRKIKIWKISKKK
jgi:hypothetical protein